MNNPEVTRVKYPLFFLAFMVSMMATAMAIVSILIWQTEPAAILNMNTKLLFGVIGAGGFCNVILLGALINHAERADMAERKLNQRNKQSKT